MTARHQDMIIVGGIVLLFSVLVFNMALKPEPVIVEHVEEQTQEQQIVLEGPEPPEVESNASKSTAGGKPEEDQDLELVCLARNIYFESRSDSLAGKVAVADVTLNRVDNVRFPNTICQVIQQGVHYINWKGNEMPKRNMCQFSWYCDGLSDEYKDEHAWQNAVQIAHQMLYENEYRGITEGSTHYHATYVNPNWTNDRGMVYVGRIGAHKFYRWH